MAVKARSRQSGPETNTVAMAGEVNWGPRDEARLGVGTGRMVVVNSYQLKSPVVR